MWCCFGDAVKALSVFEILIISDAILCARPPSLHNDHPLVLTTFLTQIFFQERTYLHLESFDLWSLFQHAKQNSAIIITPSQYIKYAMHICEVLDCEAGDFLEFQKND